MFVLVYTTFLVATTGDTGGLFIANIWCGCLILIPMSCVVLQGTGWIAFRSIAKTHKFTNAFPSREEKIKMAFEDPAQLARLEDAYSFFPTHVPFVWPEVTAQTIRLAKARVRAVSVNVFAGEKLTESEVRVLAKNIVFHANP